jgi:hypothetical protein
VHASLIYVPIILTSFLSIPIECIFLGYSPNHKGYKYYHIESGRMHISRDVVFHENRFPLATATPPPKPLDASPAHVLPPFLLASPHTQSALPSASSHTIPASPPVSHTSSAEPNVSISYSNTAYPHSSYAHKDPQQYCTAKTAHGLHNQVPYTLGTAG